MFEKAVRNKYRFPSTIGVLNVEDLWDLNVEGLDSIYKTLNSQLKHINEDSLLEAKSKEDEEVNIKIEIIKHIVNVKLKEQEIKLKEKERAEQKQRILEILKAKQDESLQNKSEEELKAILDDL